jgi:hypothetical protein
MTVCLIHLNRKHVWKIVKLILFFFNLKFNRFDKINRFDIINRFDKINLISN